MNNNEITDKINEIFVDGEEPTSILPLICIFLIISLTRTIINFYVESLKKIDNYKP